MHQGIIWDWKKRAEISMDTSPKMEAEDTSYGFRYAAIRVPTKNPDTEKYVRVTIFLVPFTAFIPRPLPLADKGHLLPVFYSGATGLPGRFSEGFSLRRSQARQPRRMRIK